VQSKIRKVFPGHFNNAQILHNNTVSLKAVKVLEQLVDPVGLPLFKNSIHRDIYASAPVVGSLKSGFELVEGKIGAPHPGIERSQSQVDRIRAFVYSGVQRLRRARRGE